VRPGSGSLGGIYTAVVSGVGPVLCVAWDMPFLTVDLLRALLEGSTDWDAFLPESDAAAAWSRCAPCTGRRAVPRSSGSSLATTCGRSASTPM